MNVCTHELWHVNSGLRMNQMTMRSKQIQRQLLQSLPVLMKHRLWTHRRDCFNASLAVDID